MVNDEVVRSIDQRIVSLTILRDALRRRLFDRFGHDIFKGSKAQRKAVVKQLRKVEAALEDRKRERRSVLLSRKEYISNWLKENLVGFWWEVISPDTVDLMRADLREIEEELTHS